MNCSLPKPYSIGTSGPLFSVATNRPLPRLENKRLIFIAAAKNTPATPEKDVLILSLAEVCNEIVTEFKPDAVVFSLICDDQDAISVVERLDEIGYRGKCIVVAPPLPNLELIKAELNAISPALTLDLISPNAD